jgi:uncharacterized membrane protein YeaQ/YmgE (transglycosylase-associated protein family)
MGWIITILVGALIGWLASLIMRTREQQGCIANILVGIVGAALGRFIFADLLGLGGAAVAGALTIGGILWGVLGAIVLIAILRALGIFK